MATVSTHQPSKTQLLSIAFSAVVVATFLYPLGLAILLEFKELPAFRAVEGYEQLILHSFLNYWIPTLLVYVALVLSPLGPRIRITNFVTWSLGIGNIVVVLYILVRIYASTIQGGGASYAVAMYVVVTYWPAVLLIFAGLVRMIYVSIRYRSPSSTSAAPTKTLSFEKGDGILAAIMVAVPAAFGVNLVYGAGSPFQEEKIRLPIFQERCALAGDTILSSRHGGASVLIGRNTWESRYENIKNGVSGRHGGGVLDSALLANYDIEYVEITERETSPEGDDTVAYFKKYFRQREKHRVDTPTSAYGIFGTDLTTDRDRELGITGEQVEIIDLDTKEVIATSTHFFSYEDGRFCGEAPDGSYTTSAFVAKVLNFQPKAN